jgi:hypothetical protein
VSLFIIAFIAFIIGIVLILLLKNVSPPVPQEQIYFDNPDDKPLYLLDREAFKEKCLEFLGKFNLEYKHSIWANDRELEIDMLDETPVVGGKYIALCIFEPLHQQVDLFKVKGFIDTVKGEGAARGILITTGYFSKDAQKVLDDDPVELVNVVSFLNYLKKFDIY